MFLTIVYSCKTELFEIELIICIKMDLALNNLQRLICHKTQKTKPITGVDMRLLTRKKAVLTLCATVEYTSMCVMADIKSKLTCIKSSYVYPFF